MFSPWYAAARRRGPADPCNHACLNVALYGSPRRWTMTERGTGRLSCAPHQLAIGPSRVRSEGNRLIYEIDEMAVPLPARVRGTVTVELGPVFRQRHVLDSAGRHSWRPIAPFARVSVMFERPGLAWEGDAYVDTNRGEEPLERAFRAWTWSRARNRRRSAIFYDVERLDGSTAGLALDLRQDGTTGAIEAPPQRTLPVGLWRMPRSVRSQGAPVDMRTFEDAPFYTRTAAVTELEGGRWDTVCESVDLRRFSARWVQTLLPFRAPRRSGREGPAR